MCSIYQVWSSDSTHAEYHEQFHAALAVQALLSREPFREVNVTWSMDYTNDDGVLIHDFQPPSVSRLRGAYVIDLATNGVFHEYVYFQTAPGSCIWFGQRNRFHESIIVIGTMNFTTIDDDVKLLRSFAGRDPNQRCLEILNTSDYSWILGSDGLEASRATEGLYNVSERRAKFNAIHS